MKISILKKNGNESYDLNIPLAIASLLITFLIAIIPAVLAYGALSERVDNLKESKVNTDSLNTKTIKNIEDRIIELEKIASGTEVSLQEIKKDIEEIKLDLKGLINDLKVIPEGK